MTSLNLLRVLVVTTVHDPEDARIRHRQLRAMVDAGFAVTYAAPFSAYGRSVPDGVRGIDLPRAEGRRRLRAVRAARRLLRRVGREHDVVLLHDPDLLLAVVGQRGTVGAPVVWDVHEDTAAALGMRAWMPPPLRGAAATVVRLAERWAESRLHLMLAEPAYRRRFRRPHPVVPNTVYVPSPRPVAEVEQRVVYLGKLTTARGGHELVDLAHRLDGVRVEVLGPATADVEPSLMAAHAAGLIDWRGFVPNDEALGRLPGALAGLSLLHDQPNYAHSRPTKLMEYMAHGVPVITTPNPASVELVEAADAGVVVGFDEVRAVVEAIDALRGDATLHERLAGNAYAWAHDNLNWDQDAQAFLDFLRSVADARRAAATVPTTKD